MEADMNRKTRIEIPNGSDYLRGQAEAAKYARVSRRTISDWQARRVIGFLKVSRKCVLFRKSEIDRALSRFEVAAV
jgi:excisionase family DNA binding protein